MDIQDTKLVRQHNLITQSKHSLSSLEMDIFIMLLSKLDTKKKAQGLYTLELDELREYRGRKINSTRLRESVSNLRSREYFIDKEDGSFLTVGILAAAEYIAEDRVLHLEIPRVMEQFLFDLKDNFTIFHLGQVLPLHSRFSKRIYQMLCQFRSTGVYKTSVVKLKEQLGLLDKNGNEKYKMFSSFRKYVLDIAQAELKNTDMPFTYELVKKGRVYKSVIFYFSPQSIDLTKKGEKDTTKDSKGDIKATEASAKKSEQKHEPIRLKDENPSARPLYERMQEKYGLSHGHIQAIMNSFPAKTIYKELHKIDWKISNGEVKESKGYIVKWFQNLLLES